MARRANNTVVLADPGRGQNSRGLWPLGRDPLPNDFRRGDAVFQEVTKHVWFKRTATQWEDLGFARGPNGWTPRTRIVSDGVRRAREVFDWIGGEGVKPATGFEGSAGLVATADEAVDFRGPQGPQEMISGLAAKNAVNYQTMMAFGEAGQENERGTIQDVFKPGATLPLASVTAAQNTIVSRDIKLVYLADLMVTRQRVASEPAAAEGKHRSADRFLPNGDTDSTNGGWWADRIDTVIARRMSDFISGKDLAIGDGIADDSVALLKILTGPTRRGGYVYIPEGIYRGAVTIDVMVKVRCHPKARFLNPWVANQINALVVFAFGAEGSEWIGGDFDGNRGSAAMRAAWTPQNNVSCMGGVRVHCPGVKLKGVKCRNWPGVPFVGSGDYLDLDGLTVEDCGSGPMFQWGTLSNPYANTYDDRIDGRPAGVGCVGQNVRNVTARRIDNDNYPGVFAHAINVTQALLGTYTNLKILDQKGNATTHSPYASGLTINAPIMCRFDGVTVHNMVSTELYHLAVSIAENAIATTFTNFVLRKFAGPGLEINGSADLIVSNGIIDGEFHETPIVSFQSGYALSVSSQTWDGAMENGVVSVGMGNNQRLQISDVVCRRLGSGGLLTGDVHLSNVRCTSMAQYGIRVIRDFVTDAYQGGQAAQGRRVLFSNCTFTNNGACGIEVLYGGTVIVDGGDYSNNGQRNYAIERRVGIYAENLEELVVQNAFLGDNQNKSVARGFTYKPGVTDSRFRYDIWLLGSSIFEVGQTVTLSGVGPGGANVTGRIISLQTDRATLQFDAATTFDAAAANALRQTLAGTWTSAGATLTGTGGAVTTEINGTTWVTNGSEWRRVKYARVDTTMILDAPFTTPLVGATLYKLRGNIAQVPSQQRGITVKATVGKFYFANNRYDGLNGPKTWIEDRSKAADGCEYYHDVTAAFSTSSLSSYPFNFLAGHQPEQFKAQVVIGMAGATNFSIAVVDSVSGTQTHPIAAAIPGAKNSQARGAIRAPAFANDNNTIRLLADTVPTAGYARLEMKFKVDHPEAWKDVA